MDFICPKCRAELVLCAGACVCASGHSYDVARAGYVNLLPSSGAGVHGDNKLMLSARRDFLNTGHYLPLRDAVCDLALRYSESVPRVIDIGCGEGYYTDKLERALFERDGESRVCAFDISKDAVRYAGARNKRVSYAVASAYCVPALDGTFSLAVNMFSPLAREETLRVLSRGGIFIVAYPGEEHLFELKSKIYDTPYKNAPEDTALDGFRLLECRRLTYNMHLSSGDEIRALFMMTPYAYRTKKENSERVLSLDGLDTTADFYICVYEKI